MDTFKDRLNEALSVREMSAAELSRLSGIDEGTLSNYKKGKYEPKQRKLDAIALALNVSVAWLMGADIPMERDYKFISPTVTEDYTTFPVIGEVAAGYDRIATEDWTGETIDVPNSYLRGRKKSEFFVLTVRGDSMYPLYQEGDKVLILKQQMVNSSGDVGVVIYADECGTLKKVEYEKGKWIKLVPINPNYPPIIIKGEDMAHCRVIGIPRLVIREINDTL